MDLEFVNKIIRLRGKAGKKWLKDLPQIIKQYEQKWNITVFPTFTLSYNYVAPAKTKDEKDVVLKISFPQNDEFVTEIKALQFFDGVAAIKVLKEDIENGVILLEKAIPGKRLRDIESEKQQISIASQIIKKLHKPVSANIASLFPAISDWGKAFDRYKKKFLGKKALFQNGCLILQREYLRSTQKTISNKFCCMAICIVIIFCPLKEVGLL